MKKKILLTFLIFILIFTSFIYATENNNIFTYDNVYNNFESEDDDEYPQILSTQDLDDDNLLTYIDGDTTSSDILYSGSNDNNSSNANLNNSNSYNLMQTISETTFIAEDDAKLENKLIDGNLFVFGKSVTIKNVVVYGDVFIAGTDVTLTDFSVIGVAFIGGQTINTNNISVAANSYICGETIKFLGETQDLFVLAENITIEDGSYIGRELFAGGSLVDITGGTIGRNVYTREADLIIGSEANITGELNYYSKKQAEIQNGSKIGKVNYHEVADETGSIETGSSINSILTSILAVTFQSAVVCLIILKFVKKQEVNNIVAYLGKSALKGFGWSILIPIVAMILFILGIITELTFGLSVVLFTLYMIALWLGVPLVATAITTNIMSNKESSTIKNLGISVVISLVIAILKVIPKLGGIVSFVVAVAGIGIIMSLLKSSNKCKKNIDKVEIIDNTESKNDSDEN